MCIFIPEIEASVGARRAEGAEDGMERDCINGVYIDYSILVW